MLKRKSRAKKARVKATIPRSTLSAKKAVAARAVVAKLIENPSLPIAAAIKDAGLSVFTQKHPGTLTKTKEWADLLDEYLPQGELLESHKGLLKASKVDHLVFTASGEPTDDEIRAMLMENNCRVRKIVHGETARHVYFFAADNKARATALDMAYKLRGTYAAEKHLNIGLSLADLHDMRRKELDTTPMAVDFEMPDVEE